MRTLALSLFLMTATLSAHAQGCSMCRDTTAGSAPQLRAGLRRAIPVLAVPAILLFGGVIAAARASDRWGRKDEER